MYIRKGLKIIGRESLIIAAIILITQWASIFHIVYLTVNFNKIFSADSFQGSRSDIKLFYHDDKLWYLKKKSSEKKKEAKFFLHVYPHNKKDLSVGRQPFGYDNLDSFFQQGFDSLPKITGKSEYYFAGIDLPTYKVQNISTGQYNNNGKIWEANFTPSRILAVSDYTKIFSPLNLLAEVNNFGVYIYDNKIYFLNRNPLSASKDDPFFLHIYPYDVYELDVERRQLGFDNLDFYSANCRLLLPELSGMMHYLIAYQELPTYRFQRIETGQYNATGRTWQFNFNASVNE